MFSKFLDPKNDVAFKRIFGTEKNKDILIHFLNDMIIFKERSPIVDVSFLKTIQDPETAAHKTSIVDILCKDSLGNIYIVEMQIARERGFEKRALYYASKAYFSQVHAGGEYELLKEVIFLAICDYTLFPKKKRFKSDHIILDRESFENDIEEFSFTFLELSKFDKEIEQLNDMVDKWCYFFKHAEETSESDLKRMIEDDQVMKRAFFELDRFSWNEAELLTYDQAEKYAWAYCASMAQQRDEGVAEGLAKGLAEGKEKGRIEERLTLIKKLLDHGASPDLIISATGLTQEEIDTLVEPVHN